MNAYCPSCETELDQATGICPACRWDPFVLAAQAEVKPVVRQRSLTEQYRGTEYDTPRGVRAVHVERRRRHLPRSDVRAGRPRCRRRSVRHRAGSPGRLLAGTTTPGGAPDRLWHECVASRSCARAASAPPSGTDAAAHATAGGVDSPLDAGPQEMPATIRTPRIDARPPSATPCQRHPEWPGAGQERAS